MKLLSNKIAFIRAIQLNVASFCSLRYAFLLQPWVSQDIGPPEQYLSIICAGPANTIPEACGASQGREI